MSKSLSFVCISRVIWALLNGRPIRAGEWWGEEIEYLAGEIIVKVKPDADSTRIDSLLETNECFAIHYFNQRRWGLIGCDTSASVFAKIDSLSASDLVEWAGPNGITFVVSAPDDPYFEDSTQWNLWNVKPNKYDADIDALEAWGIETGD